MLGEEVGAVVQLIAGSAVDAEELSSHVAAHLARFKVPTHLWFTRDPLPRNANGKILKRELKTRYSSNTKPQPS